MIANLQALRAIAAWMVVAHHLRASLGDIWAPLADTQVFAAGVDIFFVLSGFVMAVGAARDPPGPGVFWRRRLARVAPLYWLTTLVLVSMLIVGLRPVGIADWSAVDIASSMLFLAVERSDGYPGPLLGVGWTLNYEIFFYLLFAAALFAGRRAAAVAIAVIAALVVIGAAIRPEGFVARFYLAPILLEFAAGAALGLLRAYGPGRVPARLAVLAMTAGFAGLAIGAAALTRLAPGGDLITPGGAGAAWRVPVFGAPAALILWGAVAAEAAGMVCRDRRVLVQGDASYAVYLLHLPALQAVAKITGDGPALLAPGVVAVALISLVVHRRVERPLTQWLNGAAATGFRVGPFRWRDSRSPRTAPRR